MLEPINPLAECISGKDVNGKEAWGFVYKPGWCSEGFAKTCRVVDDKFIWDEILCSTYGSVCDEATGQCTGFPECPALGASCSGNIASNCVRDHAHNAFMKAEVDCGENPCDTYTYYGEKQAKCVFSHPGSIDSKPIDIPSLGMCVNNTLYWAETTSFGRNMACSQECVTGTTDNGRTFAYCK